LLLMLLRYPQELVDPADYKLPEGKPSTYRITAKEMDMAKQLIGSMSGKWVPDDYHDEFRARLEAVIKKKMKSKGALAKAEDNEPEDAEDTATNVVDFMSLLQKSIASNKRTPAKKGAAKKTARKTAKKKAPVKKAPVKKKTATAAGKSAKRRTG
jgi:DNA end-binding protein Ku